MSEHREFHYRLPQRIGGWRPGSHRGSSLGAGQEFVSHMRLYDRPDPRRLDLRASLRNIQQEWLVRINRQQASIPVHAVVDVSASMSFGSQRSKLDVAAEFVEALGQSTFRVGDSLGMLGFDSGERTDLFVPAMVSRGIGETMAALLRAASGSAGSAAGLVDAMQHLAGRQGLVFIVSDFHWPLAGMSLALDALVHAFVVPVVIWDAVEIQPPAHDGLAQLRDVESGVQRTLWMRPRMREKWLESANARRTELNQLFASRAMRPFYVTDRFDSEAMSQYFFEVAA
jgi:uncharacterized protein (DUF58 family)